MRNRAIISICLFLLLFALVEGWYLWQRSKLHTLLDQAFSELKTDSVLFLGNSHMSFGLDTDYLAQGVNLAYPSEPLLFTYLKIKLLSPRTVIIALNPQHLQKNNDDALQNGLLSQYSYLYLYAKLDREAKQDLRRYTPSEQWFFFKTKQWLPFLGTRLSSQHQLINCPLGGFEPGHAPALPMSPESVAARVQTAFENYQYQESTLQLKYLRKTVAYCQKKGIRLIFISFPIQPGFYKAIPKKVFNRFQITLKQLKKMGAFEYWDYTTHFPNHPELFYDADHLSTQGAKAFSQTVNRRLFFSPQSTVHSFF